MIIEGAKIDPDTLFIASGFFIIAVYCLYKAWKEAQK